MNGEGVLESKKSCVVERITGSETQTNLNQKNYNTPPLHYHTPKKTEENGKQAEHGVPIELVVEWR